MPTKGTVTPQQLGILKFLYREDTFCSPTNIGNQVGQFNDLGRLMDSHWSVPKLQTLQRTGLIERSAAGMYRINYMGKMWLRDNGHVE